MEEEGKMGQRSSILAIHTATTDTHYGSTTVAGITVLPVYSTEAVFPGSSFSRTEAEDAHTGRRSYNDTMIQSCRSLFEQGAGAGVTS